MRGEHGSLYSVWHLYLRIIPACAGSTSVAPHPWVPCVESSPHARGARRSWSRRPPRSRDHPRMRGEHVGVVPDARHRVGIIPACAGSTVSTDPGGGVIEGSSPHARGAPEALSRSGACPGDHPRMRGEHELALALKEPALEIIPACAGSTTARHASTSHVQESSPHARGARCGIRPR